MGKKLIHWHHSDLFLLLYIYIYTRTQPKAAAVPSALPKNPSADGSLSIRLCRGRALAPVGEAHEAEAPGAPGAAVHHHDLGGRSVDGSGSPGLRFLARLKKHFSLALTPNMFGKTRFSRVTPFLVVGQHDTLKKDGFWSRG